MTPVTSVADGLPMDFTSLVGFRPPGMMEGMVGPGPHLTGRDLMQAIQRDLGLPQEQRSQLMHLLSSPNMAERLVGGAAGGALGLAVARYRKMSGTAQALMSLAGFGLGNIIVNSLAQPGRHTQWNPETGKSRILL
jgi:hypothetical protein